MGLNVEIPCVKFPEVSADLKITLPFGELKAYRDFAAGMPTDCNLAFNLLIQISPLLASMACLLKILNVISSLKEFLEAFPNIPAVPAKAAKVVAAIGDMATCLPPGLFLSLFVTIKDILELILSFLLCLISQLESILEFQAGIDLNSAEGNPVLLASGFQPQGWLDSSTLIGLMGQGSGAMALIRLNSPTRAIDLGFKGFFVGVVQGG